MGHPLSRRTPKDCGVPYECLVMPTPALAEPATLAAGVEPDIVPLAAPPWGVTEPLVELLAEVPWPLLVLVELVALAEDPWVAAIELSVAPWVFAAALTEEPLTPPFAFAWAAMPWPKVACTLAGEVVPLPEAETEPDAAGVLALAFAAALTAEPLTPPFAFAWAAMPWPKVAFAELEPLAAGTVGRLIEVASLTAVATAFCTGAGSAPAAAPAVNPVATIATATPDLAATLRPKALLTAPPTSCSTFILNFLHVCTPADPCPLRADRRATLCDPALFTSRPQARIPASSRLGTGACFTPKSRTEAAKDANPESCSGCMLPLKKASIAASSSGAGSRISE